MNCDERVSNGFETPSTEWQRPEIASYNLNDLKKYFTGPSFFRQAFQNAL